SDSPKRRRGGISVRSCGGTAWRTLAVSNDSNFISTPQAATESIEIIFLYCVNFSMNEAEARGLRLAALGAEPKRSIRLHQLDRRRRSGGGRASACGEIVGLARGAGVGDAGRFVRGAIGDRGVHGDRSALVELRHRSAGIAHDVELRLFPHGGQFHHAVAGA